MPLRSAHHRLVGRPLAAGAVLALTTAGFVVTAAGPAAAAGPQGPAGVDCSTASGCTLTASAGTTTLVPAAGAAAAVTAPVWSFTADGSAPTVPVGPTLLLKQGAANRITVHNGLQAGALALALPGIAGVPDDLVGAAEGGDVTYTVTPQRAGTYLYEAGHTANGVRQAAMGLVGAIVVQPDPAEASPPQQDAVLVLGDLDPAFNAAPLTYDLRSYTNTYRLINGRVYPRTAPINAAAKDVVRLRYVNAGMLPHSMGVLGARQTVTAINGQDADRAPLVADMIAPGSTEDVTVVVPDTGGLMPVYDASGAQDTAGRRSGGIVSLGGMMTTIDARGTGPVSTAPVVSAGIAPSVTSDGKVTLTGEADAPSGSTVGAVEYTLDGGTATAAPITPGAVATFSVPLALTGTLVSGSVHTVTVRASDGAATPTWSTPISLTFTVDTAGPTTTVVVTSAAYTNRTGPLNVSARFADTEGTRIAGGEAFIGAFPTNGNGTGTAMNATDGSFNTAAEYGFVSIPAAALNGLPQGPVTFAVHGKDAAGNWGAVVDSPPVIVDTIKPTVGTVGYTVSAAKATLTGSANDANPIVAAEWFEGTDPGVGKATAFTVTAGGPPGQFTGTTGTLTAGTHTLSVRAQDAAGNWSAVSTVPVVVDTVAPTIGATLTATAVTPATAPTTTAYRLAGTATDNASAIAAAEWFEGTDPGLGLANQLAVTSTGATSASFGGDTPGLAAGSHTLSVRVKDVAGNWSAVRTVAVTVTVDRVFANGFESGITGWTGGGSTAGRAFTAGAALEGTTGLAVTASGTRTSYVITPTTTVTGGYHAGFLLDPSTLSTGSVATGRYAQLYSMRNAAGQRVGLYFRRNGATGGYQLALSTGAPGTTTTWTTVGTTGTVSVLVDWNGSTVVARVNGSQVGGTVALTGSNVTGSWLGLIAVGNGTGMSGAAFLDGFVANRTLPANTQPSLLP